MENTTTYIQSGILELYAIGDLSAAERLQVEVMTHQHHTIATELNHIEKALFLMAQQAEIMPSTKAKNSFFESIKLIDNVPTETIFINKETPTAKITSLQHHRDINFYKYGFAACYALLLLSVAGLIILLNSLKNSNQQIVNLQNNAQRYSQQVNSLNNQVKLANNSLQILTSPEIKMFKLGGTPNLPNANIVVMWNPLKQKVMIHRPSMVMPLNDDKHQYQLWAMVNGKPIDLGVFDSKGSLSGFQEMRNIASVETFAVTLEPKGGSKHPTMDQLMAIENI